MINEIMKFYTVCPLCCCVTFIPGKCSYIVGPVNFIVNKPLTPEQPRSCIYALMGMVRTWDVYTPGTPGMMESHIKIDTYYYHYYYYYGQTG